MNRTLILASLVIAACSAKQTATQSEPAVGNNTSSQQAGVAVATSETGGPGGLPLRGYEFDTVVTDSSGAVIERKKGQARSYDEAVGGASIEMVEIPGGTFSMGSSFDDAEQPVHQVNVSSFFIGKYEVTQAQWKAVVSLPKVSRDLDPETSFFKADNLPVECVSWKAAMEFCARLSRATGRSYRLPSEAEWEYACRAGTTGMFALGHSITTELVNHKGTRTTWEQAPVSASFRERTTPVGSLGTANGFGLYDVHGNVAEWCLDYAQIGYVGAPKDGTVWRAPSRLAKTKSDDMRIARGGSWLDGAEQCRATRRGSAGVEDRKASIGFRIVEQGPGPGQSPAEPPLWDVSDKARRALETFLAADPTYRLLSNVDIPKSMLEHEGPGKGPMYWEGFDIQQVDMPARAIAEGDASGDGIDDALAVLVTRNGDHKMYSVICFNGRTLTGYNPAPFWIVRNSADFIGKIYVEPPVFDKKYRYRTPPSVYVVYDLDFFYERADNDFYTWNGAQYEQGFFVPGEHVECPDEVTLQSQPNPAAKVVKVAASGTALLVLSAVPTRVASAEGVGESPVVAGRSRWYKVRALKSNRPTDIVGFVRGDQVTRWAEEH
jgi:formylglycine-generating enzyme required for sulfatase activity